MKEGSGFSRRVLAALAAAFMLGSIFTLGGQKLWSLWQGAPSVSPEMAAKIAELEELIDTHYLFDVDAEDAANAAAAGLSDALDQYSIYRTPEEYEAFQDHNNGDMCGIGITVSQYEEDALTVLYLSDGSPAEGILEAGDEIVAVEGQQVAEAGYQQAVSLVRGTAGTDVRLTVRRGDEIFDATVTRADIVDTGIHGEIYGNIGYVKVSAFNNATPEAFYNTVYDQIDAGVEGLVFDLRGNGGGLLTRRGSGLPDRQGGENDRHVHLRRQLHRPADGGAGQRLDRVGGGAVCLRLTGVRRRCRCRHPDLRQRGDADDLRAVGRLFPDPDDRLL